MSAFEPNPGEKRILDEDCAEDKLKSGILVLTNQRIVFKKTYGTMATFSKKEGDVELDMPLDKISFVKSEGFLVKKLVIVSGDKTFKFGVYNNSKWEKEIREQMTADKRQ